MTPESPKKPRRARRAPPSEVAIARSLDALLEHEAGIPTLRSAAYTRRHDDTDGRRDHEQDLSVIIGPDSDAYISSGSLANLRFRAYLGGGGSLRVRRGLLVLAEAIRRDNADRPQAPASAVGGHIEPTVLDERDPGAALFRDRVPEAAARQLAIVLATMVEDHLETYARMLERKSSAKADLHRQWTICTDGVDQCFELGVHPSGLRGIACDRLLDALARVRAGTPALVDPREPAAAVA